MKLLSITAALIIVPCSILFAQQRDTPREWILTLHGTVSKYYGDFTDNRFASGGELSLKKHYRTLSSGDAIYFQAGVGFFDLNWRVNTSELPAYDTSQVHAGDILRTFVMPISAKVLWRRTIGPAGELFMGTGVECAYYSPQDINGAGLAKLQESYGKWAIGIPLHAEFDYLLNDELALNFHTTYHVSFTDYLDGYSGGAANDSYLTAGIGIGYSFPPPDTDSDYDGLTNKDERAKHNTNPYNADTDGDGLNDLEEIIAKADPLNPDTDFDGMRDGEEVHHWATNPLSQDSDGDGLTDLQETVSKTNPLNTDTDSDGLSDKIEINRGTNPLLADSDGDQLPDGLETTTSPLLADSDGDGLNDREETAYQLRNHDEDFDNDGIYDGQEIELGTDPKKADTDNDEASDYVEYYCLMTNPRNPDTDGDGTLDGYDPTPLDKTPLNPAKDVTWSFSSLFNQVEPKADETSRAFLTLIHLIRSAPKGLLSGVRLTVYGRTSLEAKERERNLNEFIQRMSRAWVIPPVSISSELTSDAGLHAELTYMWKAVQIRETQEEKAPPSRPSRKRRR